MPGRSPASSEALVPSMTREYPSDAPCPEDGSKYPVLAVIASVRRVSYHFRMLKDVCLNHSQWHAALCSDLLGVFQFKCGLECGMDIIGTPVPAIFHGRPRPEGTNPLRRNRPLPRCGFCSKKSDNCILHPKKDNRKVSAPFERANTFLAFSFVSSFI